MRSFAKIKSSRNGEVTLSFTDEGKSCPNRDILTLQICLLTLFAKIKFSRKFPDLQYASTYTSKVHFSVSTSLHAFLRISEYQGLL